MTSYLSHRPAWRQLWNHRRLWLLSPKADTHFTIPQKVEGWVDLDGWLHTQMVTCPQALTHPSSNRARCRLTTLIEANVLTNTLRCHLPLVAMVVKGQRVKVCIALHETPSHSHGVLLAIWDRTVSSASWQLNTRRQPDMPVRFTHPTGIGGWVDIGGWLIAANGIICLSEHCGCYKIHPEASVWTSE